MSVTPVVVDDGSGDDYVIENIESNVLKGSVSYTPSEYDDMPSTITVTYPGDTNYKGTNSSLSFYQVDWWDNDINDYFYTPELWNGDFSISSDYTSILINNSNNCEVNYMYYKAPLSRILEKQPIAFQITVIQGDINAPFAVGFTTDTGTGSDRVFIGYNEINEIHENIGLYNQTTEQESDTMEQVSRNISTWSFYVYVEDNVLHMIYHVVDDTTGKTVYKDHTINLDIMSDYYNQFYLSFCNYSPNSAQMIVNNFMSNIDLPSLK